MWIVEFFKSLVTFFDKQTHKHPLKNPDKIFSTSKLNQIKYSIIKKRLLHLFKN